MPSGFQGIGGQSCLQQWPCLGDEARLPPRGSWPSLGPSRPGSPGNHHLPCTPPWEGSKFLAASGSTRADVGRALAEACEMVLRYHTEYHIIEALGYACLKIRVVGGYPLGSHIMTGHGAHSPA